MDSPLVSIDAGRGVVRGLLYTERGELVAVTSQEGVVRAERGRAEADARGLVEGGGAEEGDEENETVKAKL
jgi:sugar (pentulose or hexulose) kinase